MFETFSTCIPQLLFFSSVKKLLQQCPPSSPCLSWLNHCLETSPASHQTDYVLSIQGMDAPRHQTVGFKYLLRGKSTFGSVVTVNPCRALYAFVSGHWDEGQEVSPEALSRTQWLPAAWNKPADANMQVNYKPEKNLNLGFHSFRRKNWQSKHSNAPLKACHCAGGCKMLLLSSPALHSYTGLQQFKAGVCSKNWTVFFLHFWRMPNTQQHLLISNRQPFSVAFPPALNSSHWDKPVVLKQEFKSYSCCWAY